VIVSIIHQMKNANVVTGCDKTTPAQLMGGISANKPIVQLVTGPMMPGSHKGTRVGACTDCRNNWAKYRAGTIDIEEISAINEELAPTVRKFRYSNTTHLTNYSTGRNMRSHGYRKHHGVYISSSWTYAT